MPSGFLVRARFPDSEGQSAWRRRRVRVTGPGTRGGDPPRHSGCDTEQAAAVATSIAVPVLRQVELRVCGLRVARARPAPASGCRPPAATGSGCLGYNAGTSLPPRLQLACAAERLCRVGTPLAGGSYHRRGCSLSRAGARLLVLRLVNAAAGLSGSCASGLLLVKATKVFSKKGGPDSESTAHLLAIIRPGFVQTTMRFELTHANCHRLQVVDLKERSLHIGSSVALGPCDTPAA
jgi:hypothetical protein